MKKNYALAVMIVGMLAADQTFSGKPSAAGSDSVSEQRGQLECTQSRQQNGDERSTHRNAERADKQHEHFVDRHRAVVHDYYSENFAVAATRLDRASLCASGR
jgi:hypothetical protein